MATSAGLDIGARSSGEPRYTFKPPCIPNTTQQLPAEAFLGRLKGDQDYHYW